MVAKRRVGSHCKKLIFFPETLAQITTGLKSVRMLDVGPLFAIEKTK
jgi:hypothetical protein